MFDDMQTMMQRMQSLMDDAFGTSARARPYALPNPATGTRLTKAPTMALHVTENNGVYEVQAELPGVKKEDINVEINDNVVSITAKTSAATEKKDGEKVIYSERVEGSVSRRFSMPDDIDQTKSSAKFDNGVLTLTLVRKQAVPAAKQLTVA